MRLHNFMRAFASASLLALASTHVASGPVVAGASSPKPAEAVVIESAPRASQIEPMVAPVKRIAPQVGSPPAKAASNKKTVAKAAVRSASSATPSGSSKMPNIKTASKGPAKKAH